MKRILLGVCMLAAVVIAGCGEKLTDAEMTAPAPPGPQAGYVSPPPGAVKGNAKMDPRAGIPGGGGAPAPR